MNRRTIARYECGCVVIALHVPGDAGPVTGGKVDRCALHRSAEALLAALETLMSAEGNEPADDPISREAWAQAEAAIRAARELRR